MIRQLAKIPGLAGISIKSHVNTLLQNIIANVGPDYMAATIFVAHSNIILLWQCAAHKTEIQIVHEAHLSLLLTIGIDCRMSNIELNYLSFCPA